MTILFLVLGLILFQLLIILHEYGHFLVAKRNGVDVEEFGLGFPPRIVGKTFGRGIFRSYYSLNLLPIGGFVRLKGESDDAQGLNTYGASSLKVKTKILLAGILVNFLIAYLLFTILAFTGIPKLLPAGERFNEEQFSLASDTHIVRDYFLVSNVVDDSPAQQAGLKIGDRLISLTTHDNTTFEIDSQLNFSETINDLAGQTIELVYLRDGQIMQSSLTLNTQDFEDIDKQGLIGINLVDLVIYRNTYSAPLSGLVLTFQFTKNTLKGLGLIILDLIGGNFSQASEQVGGPISIFFILQSGAEYGISIVLMIIALISLTLAIMNSLPIPALDGGRFMLTIIFRKVLKKPLSKALETKIVGISMFFLLGLMALFFVIDINRYILN